MEQSAGLDSKSFSLSSFSRPEKLFTLAMSVFSVAGLALLALSRTMSAVVFYSLVLLFLLLLSIYFFWFYRHVDPHVLKMGSRGQLLLTSALSSVALGVILEFLSIIGTPSANPLDFDSWSKKRLILFVIFAFAALTFVARHFASKSRRAHSTRTAVAVSLAKPFGIARLTVLCLAFVFVCSLVCNMWNWSYGSRGFRAVFFFLCLAFSVTIIVRLRDRASHHPEYIALTLMLCLGSAMSLMLPPITGISYDDQIHFDRAYGLSYFGAEVPYSEFAGELYGCAWIQDNHIADPDGLDLVIERLNQQYEGLDSGRGSFGPALKSAAGQASLLTLATVGYLPSAVGIWLARLLGLSLSGIIILGRWFNLISYSIAMAYAIRFVPSKKIVLSTISVLPVALFLAANYSYDPWIISMLSLGIALVLRERERPDQVTLGSFLLCCTPLLLGLCPKAVYFPVIGLLFLIDRSKFRTAGRHRLFIFAVIAFAVYMVLTFILPLVITVSAAEGPTGDMRGGQGVDSGGQIAFILSNPLRYLYILFTFLLEYLSPALSDAYTIEFPPYVGTVTVSMPFLKAVAYVVLVAITLLDADALRTRRLSSFERLWSFVLFISSVALVATSLYVSFTPVGLHTVHGCQGRYLLPVLFLISVAVRTPRNVSTAGNDRNIVVAPLAIMGFLTTLSIFASVMIR